MVLCPGCVLIQRLKSLLNTSWLKNDPSLNIPDPSGRFKVIIIYQGKILEDGHQQQQHQQQHQQHTGHVEWGGREPGGKPKMRRDIFCLPFNFEVVWKIILQS